MTSSEFISQFSGEDWAKGNTKATDFMDLVLIFAREFGLDPSSKKDYEKAREGSAKLVAGYIRRHGPT